MAYSALHAITNMERNVYFILSFTNSLYDINNLKRNGPIALQMFELIKPNCCDVSTGNNNICLNLKLYNLLK